MHSEARIAQLESTLSACLKPDGTTAKGYGPRVTAIRAELDKLKAGGARTAIAAPIPPKPTLVRRMSARLPPTGPKVVYRPRGK